MPPLKCPLCKADLASDRTSEGYYSIYCPECGFIFSSKEKRLERAYLKLMIEYDKKGEKIKSEYRPDRDKAIVRSLKEVEQEVSKHKLELNKLNPTVQRLLKERKAYLVSYKFFREQTPEQGPRVSEIIKGEYGKWLEKNIFERLFKFQVEAIRRILTGENIVLVAPTGSGKTEAFTIPTLLKARLEFEAERSDTKNGGTKILFVYPTKALARDQKERLERLAEGLGLTVGVFDGDTKRKERERYYENQPDAIITNFDIIHLHLALNTRYSKLFKSVKTLVVDEVHNYVGSFGAHIHHIVKRLERFTGELQIIASSATIFNPREFCEKLFGRKFEVVEEEQGRHGETHFIMMYPSLVSGRALRANALKELVRNKFKVLAFSNGHTDAELLLRHARKEGVNSEIHRAGLTREFRERVEKRFKEGETDVLISTPTLELGIDIGHVDAIISDIVNVTKLIQRAGRAGRRGQESIVLLVLREDDPISSYYKNHPNDYFEDVSACYVDPLNPLVRRAQILSAVCDKPLKKGEELHDRDIVEKLEEEEKISIVNGVAYPTKEGRREVLKTSIRGIGSSIDIFFNGKRIGSREVVVGISELHKDAIYMHGGENYLSKELKHTGGKWSAYLEKLPRDYPYYTKALGTVEPTILRVNERKEEYGLTVSFCDLKIKKIIYGYMQNRIGEDKRGEQVLLENPVEYEYETKGFAFRAPTPQTVLEEKTKHDIALGEEVLVSSFHATEHVIIEGSNMITGGGANDMGGVSIGATGLIFVYDGTEGGNGASKLLYDRLADGLKRGKRILEECNCTEESGCPRCTYSYQCGNNNKMLHKHGALEVFGRILAGERVEPNFNLVDKTIV
ncbi:MAG: DEAD/DEAH box helicase [Nitrososphaeria archaeon]